MNGRPAADTIARHNERQRAYFEGTDKPGMRPSGSAYLRRHVEEVRRAANIEGGHRVLEIGCGMGRYTLILAEQGVRVEGLDLSPVLLDRLAASDGGRHHIPLYCADVTQPPSSLQGPFDAVIGFFMLHHMIDVPGCFRTAAALVRPGGWVAFVEPNPYNPLYYVQMTLKPGMTWRGDGGLVHMRRRPLFDAMEAAGLEDLGLTRFGFWPPFLANRPAAARVERVLERARPLQPVLPFQVFRGRRPA
jgi:SAM-dependent methyltransferase